MRYLSRKKLWLVLLMAGGTVFQTSCSSILTETVSGTTISVANEYIRSLMSDWIGISTGFSF